MTTHWGKAGQRLSEREVEQRRRANAKANFEWARVRAAAAAEARRAWAAGQVSPWRITHALGDLEGPGVDRACGVEEPTVDHWELGIVYPTWEQLEALAELTGYPVGFFCVADRPLLVAQTSMRFHCSPAEAAAVDAEAAIRFQPEAIAATLRAEGVIP